MAVVTADETVALAVVDMEFEHIRAKSRPAPRSRSGAISSSTPAGTGGSAQEAWPRRCEHRHRDGLPAGRRFRRTAKAFAAGEVRTRAGDPGAAARGTTPKRSNFSASSRASPTRRSPTPITLSEPARPRWTSPCGADARRLRAGCRFQADDRRDRRAQRVSELGPTERGAQARRRLPGGDFPDHRRLRRRSAAPPRSGPRRQRPSASGRT